MRKDKGKKRRPKYCTSPGPGIDTYHVIEGIAPKSGSAYRMIVTRCGFRRVFANTHFDAPQGKRPCKRCLSAKTPIV